MKERTKNQKGITLIALIITIVVLMILAAVAINSITNDGILGQAESIKDKYTQAQTEEQKMLDYYQLVLEQKAWTQSGTKVTRGNVTLKVGDNVTLKVGTAAPVAYSDSIASGADGDYTGNWVVLGVEYGKLLLVSATDVVASVALGGAYGGNINGTECVGGYYNGAAALDTICSKYKNDTFADEARSIKVEDINRVIGYVPRTGTTYTYTATNNNGFMHVDGRIIGKNGVESITETSTYFCPAGSTYLKDDDPAFVALFEDWNASYWLASAVIDAYEDIADFGLRAIDGDFVDYYGLWSSSYGAREYSSYGARAVVSIKPTVQVVKAQ